MKVDAGLPGMLHEVAPQVRRATDAGCAGLWSVERDHDPFLPLAVAAGSGTELEIGTAITVAFARTPMTVASAAHELQRASGGRLNLGLGSMVRLHIENRFSMPWSRPAARMREFILALRAIWRCWDDGEALDFRGEFYRHTLMPPFFSPPATGLPAPKIFLAAVGDRMTEVAGELADGMLVHSFTSQRYLREVTLPAVRRGLERANRSPDSFEMRSPVFIATGRTEEEMRAADADLRRRIAFYAMFQEYRRVFDLHGWGDLHDELVALTDCGRGDEVGRLIDDEMLNTFAVVGEPASLAEKIANRCSGLIDRLLLTVPYRDDFEQWGPVIDDLAAYDTSPAAATTS